MSDAKRGPGGDPLGPERLARAYLARVAEPPAHAVVALVAERGPVEAAELVRHGLATGRVRDETEARSHLEAAERDLTEAANAGARLVIPEDDEWPAWPLLSLNTACGRGATELAPPLALWVRGGLPLDRATEGAVAIVGARAATGYGEHTAAEFAHGLASRELPVFSGAAYGIDGAAHRGALAAGGVTAAVLGCGIDEGYPAGHVALLHRIAEHGAVISEYPPGTPPARHRFLVRNRLIAALSQGTVVVEAGTRSGAKNTAATAGALGKVVMAVPGPVGSAMSIGCHELIRDARATLVGSLEDVIDTVGRLAAHVEHGGVRRRTDGLTGQALRVHEALDVRTTKSAERVAVESGVPVPRVRAILPALELDGLCLRVESGWRLLREPGG